MGIATNGHYWRRRAFLIVGGLVPPSAGLYCTTLRRNRGLPFCVPNWGAFQKPLGSFLCPDLLHAECDVQEAQPEIRRANATSDISGLCVSRTAGFGAERACGPRPFCRASRWPGCRVTAHSGREKRRSPCYEVIWSLFPVDTMTKDRRSTNSAESYRQRSVLLTFLPRNGRNWIPASATRLGSSTPWRWLGWRRSAIGSLTWRS